MAGKENFESNLKELEEVVKALESGEVSLDEMLSLFEKGIKLTKSKPTRASILLNLDVKD